MSDKQVQMMGEIFKAIDLGDGTFALTSASHLVTKTVTIANGATVSGVLDCGTGTLVGFMTDAGLNSTAMTFQAGITTTTVGLNNEYGALSMTVAASKAYALEPRNFYPFRYVKFVGGTAETGDTVITAIIRVM